MKHQIVMEPSVSHSTKIPTMSRFWFRQRDNCVSVTMVYQIGLLFFKQRGGCKMVLLEKKLLSWLVDAFIKYKQASGM